MKILVTGGAGYIGSICAELLLARGHAVVVLDDLRKGHRAAVPAAAKFHKGDICDRAAVERVLSAERPDAVMHFAALSEVHESVEKPELYHSVNVAGSLLLLEEMAQHRVRKFIFSSTAAAYGEPAQVPIPEDTPPRPVSPYGANKLEVEQRLPGFATAAGLQYVSLRYFNVAGASPERGEDHRPESHLIPRLLEVALGQRAEFILNGRDYPTPDGTCIRDYIHVLDLAEAHILALERLDLVAGRVFNVGTSRGFSVLEVLDSARRVTRHAIPTRDGPRRAGDPPVLVAGAARIQRELGWQTRHSSLDKMIGSAWVWRQAHPQGYPPK